MSDFHHIGFRSDGSRFSPGSPIPFRGWVVHPVEYVVKQTRSAGDMTDLPFAGDSKYANVFKATGNIVNLMTLSRSEMDMYSDRLFGVWSKVDDGPGSKESFTKMLVSVHERFGDVSDGKLLWNMVRQTANHLCENGMGNNPSVIWSVVFRKIGIDGCIDCLDGVGSGTIHPSEPCQAVFFTIESISNNSRYDNKRSEEAIEQKVRHGERAKKDIRDLTRDLDRATSFDEIEEIVLNYGRIALVRVRDKDIRQQILKKYPFLVVGTKGLSDDDIMVALRENPKLIANIPGLSSNIIEQFVTEFPNEPIEPNVIYNSKNPGPNSQIALIKYGSRFLRYLDRATPEVISMANARILKQGESTPDWLVKLAKASGVNLEQTIGPEEVACHNIITSLEKKLSNLEQMLAYYAEIDNSEHAVMDLKRDIEKTKRGIREYQSYYKQRLGQSTFGKIARLELRSN